MEQVGCRGAALDTELGQCLGHVGLDGAHTDAERHRDLHVGRPASGEVEHLRLSRRQSEPAEDGRPPGVDVTFGDQKGNGVVIGGGKTTDRELPTISVEDERPRRCRRPVEGDLPRCPVLKPNREPRVPPLPEPSAKDRRGIRARVLNASSSVEKEQSFSGSLDPLLGGGQQSAEPLVGAGIAERLDELCGRKRFKTNRSWEGKSCHPR